MFGRRSTVGRSSHPTVSRPPWLAVRRTAHYRFHSKCRGYQLACFIISLTVLTHLTSQFSKTRAQTNRSPLSRTEPSAAPTQLGPFTSKVLNAHKIKHKSSITSPRGSPGQEEQRRDDPEVVSLYVPPAMRGRRFSVELSQVSIPIRGLTAQQHNASRS